MTGSISDLISRLETVGEGSRELDRLIAPAAGWRRYTPSQLRRSNPGWIDPEDFCGETQGSNGPTPIFDSLHGTTIHREPPAFSTSLDAAMSLFDPAWQFTIEGDACWLRWIDHSQPQGVAEAQCVLTGRGGKETALAACIASLRARSSLNEGGERG